MNYESVILKEAITIQELYTIHYFEYMSNFVYQGERHNFWEFVCVDKGEIEVQTDTQTFTLQKGEILFHQPNEFHSIKANGKIAPNIVVISFACSSSAMQFFIKKRFFINEMDRSLLARILAEAHNCYSSRLDDPYLKKLIPNKEQPFGGEQLIKLYLEQLLISLIRRYQFPHCSSSIQQTMKKNNSEIYNRIIIYLQEHINQPLTIEKIAKDNLIGPSQLQKLFRAKHGCGVIHYFSQLKIIEAKQLIRNNHFNFTQISEQLGYTSIHYFSRQFKIRTGMTPSEYASSIQSLADQT